MGYEVDFIGVGADVSAKMLMQFALDGRLTQGETIPMMLESWMADSRHTVKQIAGNILKVLTVMDTVKTIEYSVKTRRCVF